MLVWGNGRVGGECRQLQWPPNRQKYEDILGMVPDNKKIFFESLQAHNLFIFISLGKAALVQYNYTDRRAGGVSKQKNKNKI